MSRDVKIGKKQKSDKVHTRQLFQTFTNNDDIQEFQKEILDKLIAVRALKNFNKDQIRLKKRGSRHFTQEKKDTMGNCSTCFKSSENENASVVNTQQFDENVTNQQQQGSVHNVRSAGLQQAVAGNTVITLKNEQGEYRSRFKWSSPNECLVFSFRELSITFGTTSHRRGHFQK